MLIIFEGINGVGKTTCIKELVKNLRGLKVITNSEPYNSELCEPTILNKVRKYLCRFLRSSKYSSNNFKEWLFKLDRWLSNLQVKTYLKKGYIVIQDRSFISGKIYSCLLYQKARVKKPKFYDKQKILYIILSPSNEESLEIIKKRIEKRDNKQLSKEEVDLLKKLFIAYEEYGMYLILKTQDKVLYVNPVDDFKNVMFKIQNYVISNI